MPQILQLQNVDPKRDALLLACAFPRAALLHGWRQSVSIFATPIFGGRLLSNWAWKRRVELVRPAVSKWLPELEAVEWEEPFGLREWHPEGVVHHPIKCRSTHGEEIFVNVITDSLSGTVLLRVQTRRPFKIFQDAY